ncbi:dihydrodipicolinate synthase family protein, partial [Acinetobacter baumannii]
VTPFHDDGVDEAAFRRLVERQITEGIDGLVPVGTTGESATVDHEEHDRIVELCIEIAAGRVPVLAGAGSNSTTEAIQRVKH